MATEYSPEYLAEDRRMPAYIGVAVVTALSFVVVCVRLYARRFLIRELGWDDLFIVAAQLTSWATMALCMMILKYGAGRHLPALLQTPETLVHMYKWLVTTQMVYMFNLWLCRVSGLAFYARLNPMPPFILYLRLSFAFVTAVWFAQTLIIALQCIPLAALWDQTIQGRCMGSRIVFVSTGALTIVCDSLILLLPIKMVLGLQAKMARKLALLAILCFGVFAVATSILRMQSMLVSIYNESDATWYFSPVIAWTCAEVSAAIIALSLPALRALFGFLKEQRSTRDGNSNSYENSNGYSHGSNGIGMDSLSRSGKGSRARSKKGKVYHGSELYENTVEIEVDCVRSASQEALWDGYASGNGGVGGGGGSGSGSGSEGRGSGPKIRVTNTVDVDVSQCKG